MASAKLVGEVRERLAALLQIDQAADPFLPISLIAERKMML